MMTPTYIVHGCLFTALQKITLFFSQNFDSQTTVER